MTLVSTENHACIVTVIFWLICTQPGDLEILLCYKVLSVLDTSENLNIGEPVLTKSIIFLLLQTESFSLLLFPEIIKSTLPNRRAPIFLL